MNWRDLGRGLKGAARTHFLTGLLVMVPLALTYYVIAAIVGAMDQVLAILPPQFRPETYLPFPVPGLGLLFTVLIIQIVGFLGANLLGRGVVRTYERLLARIPLVRSIYAAVKQVMEQILSDRSGRFRRVVMFEFPRKGAFSLGFVTGVAGGEVGRGAGGRACNVFIPCTPNPTSGFYLVVPEEDLIPVDLTVEQAFKIILSGGIVGTEDLHKKARHSEERRAVAADLGGV